MAQIGLVNHVKCDVDNAHGEKCRQQSQQHRGNVVMPKRVFVFRISFFLPHWVFGQIWSGKNTTNLLWLDGFCKGKALFWL